MPKRRIIIDFDNTFKVPGCDVDDALALLYLLGCENVQLEGICTTYGNSTLEAVQADTERLLIDWSIKAPLYKGAPAPMKAHEQSAPASSFLAQALNAEPGQIDILATGSTTNLGIAARENAETLSAARSITLMGGITKSLVINGRIMNELNLSCDPQATLATLSANTTKAIATSQNCLPAFFTRSDMKNIFGANTSEWAACETWFNTMDVQYDWMGWTCWDVVAAAHLVHPELFVEDIHDITLDERFISIGYLEQDRGNEAPAAKVNLPYIKDPEAFKQHVLETWKLGFEKIS